MYMMVDATISLGQVTNPLPEAPVVPCAIVSTRGSQKEMKIDSRFNAGMEVYAWGL